jgi:hypothetical protein
MVLEPRITVPLLYQLPWAVPDSPQWHKRDGHSVTVSSSKCDSNQLHTHVAGGECYNVTAVRLQAVTAFCLVQIGCALLQMVAYLHVESSGRLA